MRHADVGWNGDGGVPDAGIGCMRQRGDDAAVDQPAFSWSRCSADCHQDDVLKTMIQPGDRPFEYCFQRSAGSTGGTCTGITRTSTDSRAHKCWAELRER